jgi:hypothetical protein
LFEKKIKFNFYLIINLNIQTCRLLNIIFFSIFFLNKENYFGFILKDCLKAWKLVIKILLLWSSKI